MKSIPKDRSFFKDSGVFISNFHTALKPPCTHRYIRSAIRKVFQKEGASLDALCINFVDRRTIKKLNNRYLRHDYYTDVITFGYNEKKNSIFGEIFMCLDVMKANSAQYKVSYKNEFERVLIHGCLHLLGYNDHTKRELELIRAKENFYLSLKRA